MLKALELFGFKSFADRTRFDFPPGISVVVGPNGSGKSNVVDAVKWVLGSQSAKSLRGKEMTDVIFNGCPTRPPQGTGEVTLTLDNADRRLAIDANEVHVSRRVYRSGEGEYLINRQPCRLKDVRELLATTGITTEAYCIIEQGKVDSLLQSSPRDRRVVFEEAAGISQFKAKKAIATRRMERVEQNLLRLSDIVDEVESRLRSIRSQAGKARRYREYTERLRQLRTEIALVDWRNFSKQFETRHRQCVDLKRQIDDRAATIERNEAAAQEAERQIEISNARTRELDLEASSTREQIAALQATLDGQRARQSELQQEVERTREQLTALNVGSGGDKDIQSAASALESADTELRTITAECEDRVRQAEEAQRLAADAISAHDRLRAQLDDCIQTATITNERIAALEAELVEAAANSDRLHVRLSDLARQHEVQDAVVSQDRQLEADLQLDAEYHRASLAEAEQRLRNFRRELASADQHYRRIDAQLTRVRERIAVLSELESRLEGLDGGVQEILRLARQEPSHQLGEVHGVVADLLRVDVDSAPLVEVALGERAQHIVLTSTAPLVEWLQGQPLRVAGRVGFLGLDSRMPPTALDNVDLSAERGVMGRADRFVESAAEYHALARRLLGRTWLVDRVATALRLAQSIGRGLEFVTSDGELISADGTIVVGPRQAATGVLSRRSELRACREMVVELEQELAEHAAVHTRLERERTDQENRVAATIAAYTTAAGNLAACHRTTASAAAKLERIIEDQQRVEGELLAIAKRLSTARDELDASRQQCQSLHARAAQLEAAIGESDAVCATLRQRQAEALDIVTERKISLARAEQRAGMLRQSLEQLQRAQQDRDRLLAETRELLAGRESQVVEIKQAIGAGDQSLAQLFKIREQHSTALAQQAANDEQLRRARQQCGDQIRAERQQLAALQAQHHKVEVASTRIRHERQTLCERMQEDYGIDLETAATQEQPAASDPTDPGVQLSARRGSGSALDRAAVEREIAELRDQINNIGAINLEALDELDQLEARFEKLSSQYRDLVDAKAVLEQITQRINAESRQLFLATLEAIRGHFQELFRRLFGGGEADIVVDDAEDVLECGIEIVARPPGKEACSISLLSGGEKTLTCVALLLAVFRSKPSPFCILDEVDAALDEANIGRFTAVLKEFLSFTQFIVITHSKKTMSGADTLYGVTMEESGVSKSVAVRFEDVSDDGHIVPSAIFHSRQIESGEQKRAA